MEIFLTILGIYLISLIICLISCYIDWIQSNRDKGSTINDLHTYIINIKGEEFVLFIYTPGINTPIAIIELLHIIYIILNNTIGKINIR